MKLSWGTRRLGRRSWIVGAAIVGLAAWVLWRPATLTYKLHDSARDVFGAESVDHPNSLKAAQGGGLTFNVDMVAMFEPYSVAEIGNALSYDPSASRRAMAVSILKHRLTREGEGRGPMLAMLARTTATDSNPTVRASAAHAMHYLHLTDAEGDAVAETLARLPPDRQLQAALFLAELEGAPPALHPFIHRCAMQSELHGAIRLAYALGPNAPKAMIDEILERRVFTQRLGQLDDERHYRMLDVLRKHAPERLGDYLRAGTVARLLQMSGDKSMQTPELQKLVKSATEDALRGMNPEDWSVAARTMANRSGGVADLITLLRSRPRADRPAMLKAMEKEPTRFSWSQNTAPIDRKDLDALVDLTCSNDHDVSKFAWTIVWSRERRDGGVRLPWTDAQRARLRERMASAPSNGTSWWHALDATMGENPTPADIAAFEKFLDEAIAHAAPVDIVGHFSFPDRHFERYLKAVGPERAAPHFVNAFKLGEGRYEMVLAMKFLEQRPQLLDPLADELIRRLVKESESRADSPPSLYSAATALCLQRHPKKLPDATWEKLWRAWMRALGGGRTGAPGKSQLDEARKLVPLRVAERVAREYFRELLTYRPPEDPRHRAGIVLASIPQNLSTQPEFKDEFARAMRFLAAHAEPSVRRRATELAIETPQDRALSEEILLKLARDPDIRVLAEALDGFGRLPKGPLPAAYSDRIRELADVKSPPHLRSIGLYRLVSLPDRNSADRELVDASADDPDDRVRAAVRYAMRNWDNPAKK